MALISAKTILTSLCLFHITLAFFFFTNPRSIADQALVYILGEAMGMPQTTAFNNPTPTTSLLALVLLVFGLSDILTLSLPEEIWLVHHWSSQAPLRATIFAGLTIVTIFTTPKRAGGNRLSRPIALHGVADGGGWDGVKNRVFFALVFVEMMSWFWVWVTLREETGRFTTRKRRRSSAATSRM